MSGNCFKNCAIKSAISFYNIFAVFGLLPSDHVNRYFSYRQFICSYLAKMQRKIVHNDTKTVSLRNNNLQNSGAAATQFCNLVPLCRKLFVVHSKYNYVENLFLQTTEVRNWLGAKCKNNS